MVPLFFPATPRIGLINQHREALPGTQCNEKHVLNVTTKRPSGPAAIGAFAAAKSGTAAANAAVATRLFDVAATGVLIAIAAIAAFTFRDYGLGWDDYTHAQYGDLLVSLYGSGFADKRALSFVNLYMYGGGFDLLATLSAKVLPFELFEKIGRAHV